MATLGEVIESAAAEYEVAYDRIGADRYALTIAFEDDRRQRVEAHIERDGTGEEWLVVSSPVGPVDKLDPVELLRRNALPGYPYVAVEDTLAKVFAQLPLAVVDAALCRRMLIDVAVFADSLEEDLLGSDVE
jgi:hypothetical protein